MVLDVGSSRGAKNQPLEPGRRDVGARRVSAGKIGGPAVLEWRAAEMACTTVIQRQDPQTRY